MALVDINVIQRNSEPYLRQALDSVLAQTFQDWRCIVVDDLSTDQSAVIAQEYMDRDPRFVLHKLDPATRREFPYARNVGLSLCTAKWVAILDGDDWWEPWKLERQLAALEQAGPGKLMCATEFKLWENGEAHAGWGVPTDQIVQLLPVECTFCQATLLMDREAVMKLGGYDESMYSGEDWDLSLRMIRAYGPDIFLMLEEPAYYYRRHETNNTGKPLRLLRYKWRFARRSFKYELWTGRDPRLARFILDFWINRSVEVYRTGGYPRKAAGWALLAIVIAPWKKERWEQAFEACKEWLGRSSKPVESEASASKS